MPLLLNFPPPSEGIHHTEPNTKAVFGAKELGKGTLYIAESVLCWLTTEGQGFTLKYPSIYVHATSADENIYPTPCLYLMIDSNIKFDDDDEEEADPQLVNALNCMSMEEEKEDEYESCNEIRFIPDNLNMLETMFRALWECQALNPEPGEEFDGEADHAILDRITISNGVVDFGEEEEEEEDEGEYDMDEEQFEDAEP